MIPDSFFGYLTDYIAVNQLPIPLSLIEGFSQITARHAEVATSENTTSTSYTDLATSGPTVQATAGDASDTTGLADGVYEISFGFSGYNNTNNKFAFMSISTNGGAAADADSCFTEGITGGNVSGSRMRSVIKTLENGGNNTVQAKYRVDGGTGTFQYRWLIVKRIGSA